MASRLLQQFPPPPSQHSDHSYEPPENQNHQVQQSHQQWHQQPGHGQPYQQWLQQPQQPYESHQPYNHSTFGQGINEGSQTDANLSERLGYLNVSQAHYGYSGSGVGNYENRPLPLPPRSPNMAGSFPPPPPTPPRSPNLISRSPAPNGSNLTSFSHPPKSPSSSPSLPSRSPNRPPWTSSSEPNITSLPPPPPPPQYPSLSLFPSSPKAPRSPNLNSATPPPLPPGKPNYRPGSPAIPPRPENVHGHQQHSHQQHVHNMQAELSNRASKISQAVEETKRKIKAFRQPMGTAAPSVESNTSTGKTKMYTEIERLNKEISEATNTKDIIRLAKAQSALLKLESKRNIAAGEEYIETSRQQLNHLEQTGQEFQNHQAEAINLGRDMHAQARELQQELEHAAHTANQNRSYMPPSSQSASTAYQFDARVALSGFESSHSTHYSPSQHLLSPEQAKPGAYHLENIAYSNQHSHLTWSAPRDPHRPMALRDCPRSQISFSTTWYYHLETPDFLICSKCYVENLWDTNFRNHFVSRVLDGGKCSFACHTSRQLLLQATRTNDLSSFLAFMRRYPNMPDCPGKAGVQGPSARTWYVPKNEDIPGFIACEACYEDIILGTSFASNFQVLQKPLLANEIWSCDVALPFIQRACIEYSKTRSWSEFVLSAIYRMNMPACPRRVPVEPSSRIWYRTSPLIDDFDVCEECYHDCAALTVGQAHFEKDTREFPIQAGLKRMCEMAILSVKIAWDSSVEKKDYNIFDKSARMIMSSPTCSATGIKDGTWFTLKSNPDNFGLCVGCYAGFVYATGMEEYFQPKRGIPVGVSLRCSFNPSEPRYPTYVLKYGEAELKHDISPFAEYVTKYSTIPPCSGIHPHPRRFWYGNDDCLICEDCYGRFVQGTNLSSQLPYNRLQIAEETNCDFYSARMRTLWKEACDRNDISGFLAFAAHRKIIFMDTVPEMRMLVQEQKMLLQQQKMLNVASTTYNVMGATQSVMQSFGPTYGNPYVGYGYPNAASLQGAALGAQASNIAFNSSNPGRLLRVRQLEAKWKQVE